VRNMRGAWWRSRVAWHSARPSSSSSSSSRPILIGGHGVVPTDRPPRRGHRRSSHSRCGSWSVREWTRTAREGRPVGCHSCSCASGTEPGGFGSHVLSSVAAEDGRPAVPQYPVALFRCLARSTLPRAGRLTREPFPAPQPQDRKRGRPLTTVASAGMEILHPGYIEVFSTDWQRGALFAPMSTGQPLDGPVATRGVGPG
jgi:hypothetical protein